MSDNKEFRVRHGLVVGNNVLVANVTSNTVTIQGTINATSLQVNGTTIPSGTTSNLVFDTVNTAFNVANAAFGSANNVAPQVAPAYNTANAAYSHSNTTYAAVNSAFAVINAAFASANNVAPQVAPAFNTANAAYTSANAAGTVANNANTYAASTYVKKAGDTITGDLVVTGNLTTSGTTTFANTQTLLIGDNILTLNADIPNTVAPTEDAGIEVNRGSSANVAFKWNESIDNWTFTSGTGYYTLPSNTWVETVYTTANAAYSYANNIGYFTGNNGDKGNATGLGDIFRVHSNTLSQNVTIYSGNNATAVGPLNIVGTSTTLTIQPGARVAIV